MTQAPSATRDTGETTAPGYEHKADAYFGGVRSDFLALLQNEGAGNVLEIGCGTGDTGAAALARGLAHSYIGVEIAAQAASVARTRLTEVLEGDVERMALPWPDQHFDAVLMSEVLEHLVDPWTLVKRVAEKLKPGALVLASSPNVAQIAILRGIIADSWELPKKE